MLRILASLPSVIAQTLGKEGILVPECTEFCHVSTLPSVGLLDSSAEPDQARELFLDQKTKDAVHMACVITPIDLPPTPVQVIKINY